MANQIFVSCLTDHYSILYSPVESSLHGLRFRHRLQLLLVQVSIIVVLCFFSGKTDKCCEIPSPFA
jgi:hypothetical protein